MTTPASFPTANRIITYAMKDAGILQEGDLPNSDQFAEHRNRLCDLINMWQTQGLKLWVQTDQSVTPIAGQVSYTFMPGGDVNITRPLRALQGYYLDSTGANRRPIYPLSWDEWLRLSSVTQQGSITQYFVEKLKSMMRVSFWLIPDTEAATGTAHLLIQQQIENFSSITDTMDFPQEWFMALRWGLADDICTGQPAAIVARCAQRAEMFRNALEDWDVEDASTSFAPDQRGGVAGRFI